MNKWDFNFLSLAATVSNYSKDPSTKVGAVIVDDNNRIVSMGYNGFPKGIKDDGRLNNRIVKYQIVIHAEINAILFAEKSVENCTIYTFPFMPCSNCSSVIIQKGIKRVVSVPSNEERWIANFKQSEEMFKEVGIDLEIINLT
jgi:dCMP deaminase